MFQAVLPQNVLSSPNDSSLIIDILSYNNLRRVKARQCVGYFTQVVIVALRYTVVESGKRNLNAVKLVIIILSCSIQTV